MNSYNEKITIGQLFKLLLMTNRFDSAKCTIWDNSRAIYVDKVGYIKENIISGKLAEVSNSQYLFDRKVEELKIKGFLKNQIEIVVSRDKENIEEGLIK